jgi:hypothetical protein
MRYDGAKVPPRLCQSGSSIIALSGYGNRRVDMAYLINCECGAQVRSDNEDSLVLQVEQHVADTHPELKGKMTRDDIMAMAEQV